MAKSALKKMGLLVIMTVVVSTPRSASAAIVGYTNLADFQTAIGGAPVVIDFDGFTPNTILPSSVGDVSFSVNFFDPIGVYGADPTISGNNYIGFGNFGFPVFQGSDNLVISVPLTNARNAVGLFVQYETNSDLALSTVGGSIEVDDASGVSLGGAFEAYFLGLVDDTGANSITSVSLTSQPGGPFVEFFVDDVQTFSTTAVPEPSSLAFLALGVVVFGWRRRRAVGHAPNQH